jgi:hypothetical protein
MQHPLEIAPDKYRKPLFFVFLILTVVLFAILRVLDQPLQTDAAPNGIVSFELAGDPLTARAITDSWKQLSVALSSVAGQPNPDVANTAYVFAAFGLGIDYLFIPTYTLALAFGTLLAAQKHAGWLKFLATLAGYGAFLAALFDAGENFALLRVLLGTVQSNYPAIAAYCAMAKFGLLIFGIVVCLVAWIVPQKRAPQGRS